MGADVLDDLAQVRCERCGHLSMYHQLDAPEGERRCVWNPEQCDCPDLPAGARRHLRSV